VEPLPGFRASKAAECRPARGLKRLRCTSVSTPSGCVRRGTGDSARPPRELIPSHRPSTSPKTQWPFVDERSLTRIGIQHTQRRCAAISCGAPILERIATLAADHRDFFRLLPRAHVRREGPNPSVRVSAGKSYRFRWLSLRGHGVALVLDQVEDRAFDASQASAHDG
jgi:hypothetical protein